MFIVSWLLGLALAFPIPTPHDLTLIEGIISIPLSPSSNNAVGNANLDVGDLTGNQLRRRTDDEGHADDIVSNSLSPLSNNAA